MNPAGSLGDRKRAVQAQVDPTTAKVLIVGPAGSGKTSIADFVSDFSQSLTKPVYEPTVAVRYGGVAMAHPQAVCICAVRNGRVGALGSRQPPHPPGHSPGDTATAVTAFANHSSTTMPCDEAGYCLLAAQTAAVDAACRRCCGFLWNGRILEFNSSTGLPVELWDVSGDRRFDSGWPAIQKDATAVIIVFNGDDSEQESSVSRWCARFPFVFELWSTGWRCWQAWPSHRMVCAAASLVGYAWFVLSSPDRVPSAAWVVAVHEDSV